MTVSAGDFGQRLDRLIEQPPVIIAAELFFQNTARDRYGHVGGFFPDLGQSLIAGRENVARRRCCAASASPCASLTI